MKVLDPGHDYILDKLDSDGYDPICPQCGNTEEANLTFVKRQGEMYPGNTNSYEGTNMQEVLRVLINRCMYVNNQIFSEDTLKTIDALRQAFFYLERRAADRHGRELPQVVISEDFGSIGSIEYYPHCSKCGHIGCVGECHE